MEKQYIISEKEYNWIHEQLQKAIVSENIETKQFCLREFAIHFGMNITGGMAKIKTP